MTVEIRKRQHVVNIERPSRTRAGDTFSAFAITALKLAGHLTAAGDQIARPAGQNSARWQILAGARHETLSVAQIAKLLGLARQGVQRLADVLEAEGLVTYADNPNHRRAKLVALTPKGRTSLSVIEANQAVWADTLGAEFDEDMVKKATEIMALVLDRLAR